MSDEKKPTTSLFTITAMLLFASFIVAGALLLARAGYIKTTNLAEKIDNLFGPDGLEGIIPDVGSPDVVGVEVYDLSVYEQSEEAYAEALARMESDWFPRPAGSAG